MGNWFCAGLQMVVFAVCLGGCGASSQSAQSAQSLQAAADVPPPLPKENAAALDKPGAPRLLPNKIWDCPFPQASDEAAIDQAVVSIVVAVKANGEAAWVQVLEDPGYNFGLAAGTCAMHMRFVPGRNAEGVRVLALTPPIRVRFTR